MNKYPEYLFVYSKLYAPTVWEHNGGRYYIRKWALSFDEDMAYGVDNGKSVRYNTLRNDYGEENVIAVNQQDFVEMYFELFL